MTLETLEKRHSVRSYSDVPLNTETEKELEADINMINSHEAGFHFTLFFNQGDPFKGFRRSYGMFRGVRNYLAAVVDTSFPDAHERAGYFAEQFVMKLTELGLGSCFVGGTYDAASVPVQIRADWKLLFLVAFGHEGGKTSMISSLTAKMAHRHERLPRDFFSGSDTELNAARKKFPWIDKALRAVAAAPSALNRQPVRISLLESEGASTLVAGVSDPNPGNLIDLGIAKFNFAAVAPGDWEWGNNAPFYVDEQ